MNLFSQTGHEKFFSPVCVLRCLANSSDLANLLAQPTQLQGKGRSPGTKNRTGHYVECTHRGIRRYASVRAVRVQFRPLPAVSRGRLDAASATDCAGSSVLGQFFSHGLTQIASSSHLGNARDANFIPTALFVYLFITLGVRRKLR